MSEAAQPFNGIIKTNPNRTFNSTQLPLFLDYEMVLIFIKHYVQISPIKKCIQPLKTIVSRAKQSATSRWGTHFRIGGVGALWGGVWQEIEGVLPLCS